MYTPDLLVIHSFLTVNVGINGGFVDCLVINHIGLLILQLQKIKNA